MRKPETAVRHARIYSLYKSGMTRQQLQERYGYQQAWVYRIIQEGKERERNENTKLLS